MLTFVRFLLHSCYVVVVVVKIGGDMVKSPERMVVVIPT